MPPKGTKGKRKKKTTKKKPNANAKKEAEDTTVVAHEPEPVTPDPAEKFIADAKAAKDRGNACIGAKDLAGAVEAYSEAISLAGKGGISDGTDAVFYGNRSMALLSLNRASEARADAAECVRIDPAYAKGHGRLGAALFALGDFAGSVKAYEKGLEVDPSNAKLKTDLQSAVSKLKQKVASDASEQFATGTKVLINGLSSAAGKQHNGKAGVVQSFDSERYDVLLENGNTLRIKPGNLSRAAATEDVTKATPEPEEEEFSKKCIGIDLGTTNSCVGVWIDEEVVIIPNDLGKTTTPSFVAFDGEQRIVGEVAKSQQVRNISNTVYDAKRLIGQKMGDPGMQEDCRTMQYDVQVGAGEKPQIVVKYRGKNQRFAPEEISAMVLSKMKATAEAYLGEKINQAVITVPAYFNDSQRAATKAAGRIAGLQVRRIINEPTAAALAYGLDRTEKITVLVFDLGGGTFDVSVLTIDDGIFEVVATGGDTRLGGEDFDHALMNHFVKHVKHNMGVTLDNKKNAKAMKRLKVAAQEAKETLSSSSTTFINLLSLLPDGRDLSIELTRDAFDKIMKPWTTKAMDTVKKVMKDGKLRSDDIGEVVLVGGSTRIPIIQEMLQKYFGGRPLCKSVNPDECVAYGAAVQGAILSGERSDRTSALLLVDVTPLSLGVEVEGKIMSTVVKRNTAIPCSKSSEYTTTENFQTSIDISIYEGERSCTDGNNMLGEFTITGVQRAKRGEPKVEVQFDLDANGMLKVTARDKATGAENNIVITNSKGRLSSDEVDKMVSEAQRFAQEDADYLAKAEARNELEALVYNVLDYVSQQEDPEEGADKKAREQQEWLERVGFGAQTEEYKERASLLRTTYGLY